MKQQSHRDWQFRVRDLLFVAALCAAFLGWWRDHRQLQRQIARANLKLEALHEERELSREWQATYGAQRPFGDGFANPDHVTTVNDLLELLEDANEDYYLVHSQRVAATRLADEALPQFAKYATDAQAKCRERAATSLQHMATHWQARACDPQRAERLVPIFLVLLDDTNRNVQCQAALGLRSLAGHASSAVPALRRHAMSDASPIAAVAATTLHVVEPGFNPIPRLGELLRRSDDMWRFDAVKELEYLGSEAAKEALLDAYSREQDSYFRASLARAIARIEDREESP